MRADKNLSERTVWTLTPDPIACYQALLTRDRRNDGLFFNCVKTTGIYCRPICAARTPKPENCHFVPSAAAAQEAGFRPCLQCHPESAPDFGAWRGSSTVVSRAMALIEEGALDADGVETLTERLGTDEARLNRLFQQHIGASPLAVAQTRRELLAKQLIHQTSLSMEEITLASGFKSVQCLNATFQMRFKRLPEALRHRSTGGPSAPGISLLLPYRPPYDWQTMIGFLQTRAIPGLEIVTRKTYTRVIELDGAVGSIHVSDAPDKYALRTTISFPNLKALPKIIARIRRIFDLAADPQAISSVLSRDSMLAPLILARPGLRVPGAWDGLETAIRAVLGQQITVREATVLAGKFVLALGRDVTRQIGIAELTHTFPEPRRITYDTVAAIGLPRARAATIAELAAATQANPSLLEASHSLDDTIAGLCQLPGIGEWTAHYIAMRVMRESDAFLAADVALQRILAVDGKRPNTAELLVRAECWRPWRAYAVLQLWTAEAAHSLEGNKNVDATVA